VVTGGSNRRCRICNCCNGIFMGCYWGELVVDSVRRLQTQKETMDKYHAEISRFVDAAQIHCKNGFDLGMVCQKAIPDCPFRANGGIGWCNLKTIVKFLGGCRVRRYSR
jgi:hypothetical protein